MLFLVPILMPKDVTRRNRTTYEVGDEEMVGEEEDALYDKKHPSGPHIIRVDSSEPVSTDSSFLTPRMRSPNSLSVQAKDPTMRASWLEVNMAVAGGDPSTLVIERMTSV